MDRFVRFVRWFNYAVPWNKLKYRLLEKAHGHITPPGRPEVYDGIQGNLRMRLDLSSAYHRAIYLNGYEIVTLPLLRRILRPGDTVVDGGANVGLLSLVCAQQVGPTGKVYSFEPNPETFAVLNENVALNGLKNVTTFPLGVWDSESSATLYKFEEGDYPSQAMAPRLDRETPPCATIQTTCIDRLVKPPVKLIKLDIEGAEYAALRGAKALLTANPRPHLILEICPLCTRMFGYQAMEMVDWILGINPNYRMWVLRSRRIMRITRDELAKRLDREGDRGRNLWFEPV